MEAILLIGLASALNINLDSGDSTTFDIGITDAVSYTLTGIDAEYLNISQNGSRITLSLSKYAPDSNFSIEFYVLKDEPGQSSGGSSSHHTNIVKQNNTNQTNCLTGKKMCSGDFVYTCDGVSWVLTEECPYGCEDNQCSQEPIKETIPEQSNKKPSTLLIIIVLSILTVFFIIYTLLKLKIIKIKKVD